MAAEGRNRQVLGDIGNMITLRGVDGKQELPQVSRPLTRGFCAQLLANAQAAAADKNTKCIGAVNVDGVTLLLQMEVPRKPPSQKRASVKPIKPEAVIVISPDTKEEAKEKNSFRRKAAAEDSSRKTYECNGDMHVGSLSFSRRMNSSANLAAETPAPSINRQGSWNQPSDQRQMQAKSSQPPIRKPALIGQMRSCGISQAACALNNKLPKEKIEVGSWQLWSMQKTFTNLATRKLRVLLSVITREGDFIVINISFTEACRRSDPG